MTRNRDTEIGNAAAGGAVACAGDSAAPVSGQRLLEQLEAEAWRVEVPTAFGTSVWRRWGNGPPVLLLHGGTGSWRHWICNLQALSASYTVWAPDMPGYGDSDDAPDGADAAGLATVLSQALDVAIPGGVPVALVGFSFGGIVATHLAAARPDRIERLVLVGPVGLGVMRRPPDRDMVRWRGLADAQAQRDAHRHNLSVLMMADPARIDDLAIEIQRWNAVRTRLFSKGESRGDALLEPLRRVRVPVYTVWGRHDATSNGDIEMAVKALHAAVPQARWRIVDDAGHWVQYESVEACNAIMLEWLADRGPAFQTPPSPKS